MTAKSNESSFTPRPRQASVQPSPTDTQNFRDELLRIHRRTTTLASSDRTEFTEGSPTYDIASMALIRLASLLDRPEFAHLTTLLTVDERAAIRATRNIAAHAGYVGMNDDLFWVAVTVRVPGMIQRLLDGLP